MRPVLLQGVSNLCRAARTVTVVAPGLLALAVDAKILLYGCRACATAAGQALVASPIH